MPTDVEIWQLDLDELILSRPDLKAHLSAAERARGASFRRALDGARFEIGRGWLRETLAARTNTGAATLTIEIGRRGKPFVPGSDWHFNLAHAGQSAIFALARGRRVGVDIERWHADLPLESLAQRALSPRESSASNAAALLRIWTRKEALLKALGCGLTLAPAHLEVCAKSGVVARYDAARGSWRTCPGWRVQDVPTFAGCVAAMAVEGELPTVTQPITQLK